MNYRHQVHIAFNNVEYIMEDVEGGWLLDMCMTRLPYSLYVVYLYMPMVSLLMILTAFIGYGATVITSSASAIPVVRHTIVTWLLGDFSVDNATLNQFFNRHYLLPFILVGANNIFLYPYFYVKDLVGWVDFAIVFSVWIFFSLNVLGHPDNYMPPMSTPAHIILELYFLLVYAILHTLPFMKRLYMHNFSFCPIYQGVFWLLLADRYLLGWIGCQPVEPPFVTIGQISPLIFFLFFVILPLLGLVRRENPHSYTDEPVTEKDPISMCPNTLHF
ncbi:hypothetical protein MKW92_004987 [Papaver armeniacum]|nr:hypothetical protein MKW92_004987 [Papaver armeniacum]